MLRKLGRLEMLHRGTHRASGWLAGSRCASRCTWMMMMLFPLPSGPYFPGKLAGVLLQEGGFPCRDLLEGWGPGRGPS